MISNYLSTVFFGLVCLVICCIACPPPADMSPCVCRRSCNNCPLEMICNKIQSVEVLTSVFYKTKNYPFKDFYLNDSCISYIPAQNIEEKQFSKIVVENGCLGSVFDRPPSTDLLREFSLKNITIRQGFQWELFKNLSNLRSFVVSDVFLRKISSQFGSMIPKSIQHIQFENTMTLVIESGAFSGLTNLKTIHIGRSKIRALSRDMFPRPAMIKAISVISSKIQSLPADMFEDMPDLRVIIFSNSLMTRVPKSVFGNILPKLNTLVLYNNPIRCDCLLKWIVSERKRPQHLSAQCKEPAELKDRQVKYLKQSDITHC